MKSNYINALLDDAGYDSAVTYQVINGVNVSTIYITQVQKLLAEQPEGQFTVTRGNGDLNVRLNKEVKNVCHECGSPHFFARVINEYSAYIDERGKAHPTLLTERCTSVQCQLCGEPKEVTVFKYPKIAR